MIWWTGLAPWEFEIPFPGSLIYTFLEGVHLPSREYLSCLEGPDIWRVSLGSLDAEGHALFATGVLRP